MVQRKPRSLEDVPSKFTTEPGPSHAMLMLEEQRISQICIIYEQRGAGTGGRDGCCVDVTHAFGSGIL